MARNRRETKHSMGVLVVALLDRAANAWAFGQLDYAHRLAAAAWRLAEGARLVDDTAPDGHRIR